MENSLLLCYINDVIGVSKIVDLENSLYTRVQLAYCDWKFYDIVKYLWKFRNLMIYSADIVTY